jgi:hypothetical protein
MTFAYFLSGTFELNVRMLVNPLESLYHTNQCDK